MLKTLDHMYGETIPAGNLHLIMGTMAAHPRTFIIIGLLRSALDPAELAALYGVTTARLNQQVRRNRERFPADFLLRAHR